MRSIRLLPIALLALVAALGAGVSHEEGAAASPGVDLTITKLASPAGGANVAQGSTITYYLTAMNATAATGTATGVVIRDYVGTGLTFTSATPGTGVTCGDVTPPEINCTVASLAPAGTATVTIVATVATSNGALQNGAYIDPDNAITELNEDADDPDHACAAVGEGSDTSGVEPDNYSCTVHSAMAATATPSPTPTLTPTPPAAVGGVVELTTGDEAAAATTGSTSATENRVPIGGAVAAGVIALTAVAWYSRRRWARH